MMFVYGKDIPLCDVPTQSAEEPVVQQRIPGNGQQDDTNHCKFVYGQDIPLDGVI